MQTTELILNLLYSAIGIVLVCLAGFLLAWLLWRTLRVKADREHPLVLENKGNCRNIYYLEVKSPEPSLRFSLLYNELPLAEVYLPVESETVQAENSVGQADQSRKKPATAAASSASTVTKTGQSVSSAAGKSASFLEQIAQFLPKSLSSKLKQQASTSRAVQSKVLRTSRAPERARQQVTGFKQLRTGEKASSPRQSNVAPQETTGGTPVEAYFVQSPAVEPGQSLDLKLTIGSSRRRYPQGSYSYTIEALPMPVDFPDVDRRPFLQNCIVNFNPIAWWRYSLPVISTIVLSLVALTGLVFLYRFIWL
jgi:hypothetical protein